MHTAELQETLLLCKGMSMITILLTTHNMTSMESCLGLYRSLLPRLLNNHTGTHASFLNRFISKEESGGVEDWIETELQDFLLELAAAEELSRVNIY